MNLFRFVKGRWRGLRMRMERRRVLRASGAPDLQRSDWERSLSQPNEFYLDCVRYFHLRLPKELRDHRMYFTRRRRGFGEDAFHAMWFLLFREFHPASFLEIGVYRGQTTSLVGLLARMLSIHCDIHGISPFSSAADSVSSYLNSIDYYRDTLRNFETFSLPLPKLLKGFSTDAEAQALVRSRQWHMIYIDGNHDYEVAKADWEICAAHLIPLGVIVLDDSGLTSKYQPTILGSAGHPGPSKVAAEVSETQFREILQVGHNRVFQKLVT